MKRLLVASGYPIRNQTFSTYQTLREVITTSRLNFKPDLYPFKLLSEEISQLPKRQSLQFDECCEARVADLEKTKTPIYVLWSGGIDSTAVLVSFLKHGSVDLRKRTTVLMNLHSLKEYPAFFKTICREFKMETSFAELETYTEKGLVITGELGDQLFGSDIIFDVASLYGEESLKKPYQDILPKLFINRAGEKQGLEVYQGIEGIAAEAPFALKTCFDFLWWWNFSQKWQHVKFRFLLNGSWKKPEMALKQVQAFYDSVDFQLWSIQNHNQKIGQSVDSYKHIVKQIIVETTGDTSYSKKLKKGSLGYIWFGKSAHFALNEEFQFVPGSMAISYIKEKR